MLNENTSIVVLSLVSFIFPEVVPLPQKREKVREREREMARERERDLISLQQLNSS